MVRRCVRARCQPGRRCGGQTGPSSVEVAIRCPYHYLRRDRSVMREDGPKPPTQPYAGAVLAIGDGDPQPTGLARLELVADYARQAAPGTRSAPTSRRSV